MNIRICFLTLFLAIFSNSLLAQTTYVVNSNADGEDNDLTNSACDDGSGNCTLRAAIQQVNHNNGVGGGDIIQFNLGSSATILLDSALAEITSSNLTIDGTENGLLCGSLPQGSQHSLKVSIDGSNVADTSIFRVKADGVAIKGLIIINSGKYGIDLDSDNATIECNYIGTDGTKATLGSTSHGINISSSLTGISIHNNLISGNNSRGINTGKSAEITVTGNLIGTNENGDTALKNKSDGIYGAIQNSIIGGGTDDLRNIISGNGARGFYKPQTFVGNITFENNYIGVDITAENALGNAFDGLNVRATNNSVVIKNNVISGNGGTTVAYAGIQVSSDAILTGNKIGTDKEGDTDLGNAGPGVIIRSAGSNNVIGGSSAADQNIIAFNGASGVEISATNSLNNKITGNSIFSNVGLGIDLGSTGLDTNDANDVDEGANNLQNYPEVHAFTHEPGDQLSATINVPSSTSNSSYPLRLEFFESDGNGEGKIYLGYAMYESADAESTVKKFLTLPTPVYIPDPSVPIIATATDDNGNTSEFSSSSVFLPVELLSFNYSFDIEDRLWLSWSTASELNNEGFSILQSSDGLNWSGLGWVRGNGTTRAVHYYRFQVPDQYAVDSYFRLKQVDFDGASALLKAIFVEGKTIKDLSVFPSIINKEFSIAFVLKSSGAVSIKLRDLEGKVAQRLVNNYFQAGRLELRFNLSDNLKEGSYLVEIKADSFQATRKVLLRR